MAGDAFKQAVFCGLSGVRSGVTINLKGILAQVWEKTTLVVVVVQGAPTL